MIGLSEAYPSKTSPGKSYVAGVDDDTGLLSCNCRGWTMKREGKPRFCDHCKDLAARYSLVLEERDGQMFVVGKGAPVRSAAPLTFIPDSPRLAPMLAVSMPADWDADSYAAKQYVMEEKFDGHRIVSEVSHGRIAAWSRGAKARTLPTHIARLMTQLPDGIYDGELIIPGGHSYDVTAGQNSGREVMVLFDLMAALGDQSTVLNSPFYLRRLMLEAAVESMDGGFGIDVVLAHQTEPNMKRVRAIWKRGGEGAIIKNRNGLYRPGMRSDDWIKVKAAAAATLTIVGYEAGKVGEYSAVKLRDDKGIETSVKTLDNATMRQMIRNPASFIGRRLVISYQERTPTGKYRHPMWDHLL